MAQGDYLIQNQSFPSFRSDLNDTLEAINTSNSGTSRPTSAVAGTVWLDTTSATTPTLKFYDGSDDISLATLDYTANTVNWLDSSVVVDVVGDTTPQLGGNLDVNGNSIVSVSNGNITFTPDGTGKVIIDGLSHPTADGTSGQFMKTDGSGNLSFDTVDLTNLSATNLTSGTVPIARLGTSGTKDATTFLRGDNTFASAGGGNNTPNFEVKKTSNQSISNASWTKVTFQSEAFDSDSALDLANDKFTVPSGEGGKYFFYCALLWDGDDRGHRKIALRKNGSTVKVLSTTHLNSYDGACISAGALLDLSASDYIEIFCYQNSADPQIVNGDDNASYFGGFKLL